MSDLDLYADLGARKLISRDGGAVTLPTLVLGDQVRCTLRTMERMEGGDLRERDLRVRTLRASIGKVLAAPTGGWFKLWVGDYDTPQVNFDADADTFKTAAQGSGIIDTVESPATGTWVVKTTRPDSEPDYPIYAHTNKLAPISFVRVRQFKQLGVWWFECRLIQAPLAFNGGHERVLPPPPTVRRVREGSAGSETEPPVNELQALHLPPDFRGTYFLRWNYRVSKLLGIEDGPDEIAAALNAMFEKGGKRFEVTNPEADQAYVEFIGDLAGSPQPLVTVEVNTFAPGVLTFTLSLERAEMWQPGERFSVEFDLELQLINANTRTQHLIVIETGAAPGQTTPAPVGENLENIVWRPTPLLAQRIIVTSLKLKHHFGAAIKRSLDNVLTAERLLYTTPAASNPSRAVTTACPTNDCSRAAAESCTTNGTPSCSTISPSASRCGSAPATHGGTSRSGSWPTGNSTGGFVSRTASDRARTLTRATEHGRQRSHQDHRSRRQHG